MIAIPQHQRWFPKYESTESRPVTKPEMLLMFFFLCISGNPFFGYHSDLFILGSSVISFYYIYHHAYNAITFRTLFIFFFLLGYELMHAIVYSLDYSFTIFKLTLVLLLGYSVVHMLGDRFIKVLTRTMVILTIISFIFTFLCYIPGINRFLYELALKIFPMDPGFKKFVTPTFLVYTFHPQYFMGEYDYARNAGPFWESGAFASFLIVNLFLIYSTKTVRKVSDLFDRQSTILVLGVISTTSTMGFLALAILLSFFTWQLKSVLKYFMLLMIVLMSVLAFTNVSYLGNKVQQQLDESGETNNRFGAFLMDLEEIEKRPLIGSSRRIQVIFKTQVRSAETRRPNGFSNFIRDYGLIYSCVYFALVFASFRNVFRYYHGYTKASLAFFGVLILCIISFSELLFDLAFFKGLIFLFATYDPRRSPYMRNSFQQDEHELVEERASLTT